MRRSRRSRTTVQAWLFGLAVPAVALFMLFSLLPYDRMVGHWPWGIGKEEVMAFQHLFDRRPGQHVEGHAEVFTLSASGVDGNVTLSAGKDQAAATITPLLFNTNGTQVAGGMGLDFPEEHPFRGATAMALVPADLRSLETLYAQAVADSLDIIAPGPALVQVERDDKKLGPFIAQERITPDYVLKHAPLAMVLVSENGTVAPDGRPTTAVGDTLGNAVKQPLSADHFDTAATAALGLLALAEQRSGLLQGEAGALYDRVTGRVLPLYRMRFGNDTARSGGPIPTAFRSAMATARNQARINRLAARLRADSAAWAARFLAIDSVAVPVLAKGRNIGLVQAEVDHTREQFMQRLFHPATASFLGAPTRVQAAAVIPLDPWLKPFRTDPDTIRFVRGKYAIDHDLVLPKGMALVLERGARWFIAPGVSVVVNGELHTRGTELNPVFIRPQDDAQPFGSIAVNGTGDTRARIRGLRMSGGSDLLVDGIRHGGMLSFIRADVRMDHCSIGATYGDASVSLQRGTMAMSDCYLAGAAHSFVDLYEVEGSVERCAIVQPAGDGSTKGRSGIGLRASRMLLRNCTFAGLPFVALRSARDSKVLLTGCQFNDNAVAVRGSDGSELDVDGCTFSGNAKVFVLQRDQVVLGGATLTLYANTMIGNTTEQEADTASKVRTGTTVDPKVLRAFGAQP